MGALINTYDLRSMDKASVCLISNIAFDGYYQVKAKLAVNLDNIVIKINA